MLEHLKEKQQAKLDSLKLEKETNRTIAFQMVQKEMDDLVANFQSVQLQMKANLDKMRTKCEPIILQNKTKIMLLTKRNRSKAIKNEILENELQRAQSTMERLLMMSNLVAGPGSPSLPLILRNDESTSRLSLSVRKLARPGRSAAQGKPLRLSTGSASLFDTLSR
mmetsp:Transcript_22856/g.56787  ORF Transcript_22856/g.56787 Transcript_22856/m.56787 type:complete len:166 (+) Transcript_22856:654-1151(+)